MANNKRFFKTISLAHWHVKLSIAAQLPKVLSFRWEDITYFVHRHFFSNYLPVILLNIAPENGCSVLFPGAKIPQYRDLNVATDFV